MNQVSAMEFEIPEWAGGSDAEVSVWESFSHGFGAEGNEPDVAGSNAGGSITQSTPGGMVTGTGNIYNPAAASVFTLKDNAGSAYRRVVLQAKSMGALVVNEVVLSYESEGETVRMVSDESREVGRLEGNRGDTLIHYWSWNLEGKSLESISIEFKAQGPHLSLDAVRLDTLLQSQPAPLEFEIPEWAGGSDAEVSVWESFSHGFGAEGNEPDVAGSNTGGSITQSTPGGMVTGTGNIYNPAAVSVFTLKDNAGSNYRRVVLQAKSMGALVVNEVVLSYESEGETVRMVSDESREVGRLEGNRGDTLIHYWSWNLEGKSLESISIEFKARGPHLSLDAVRLDTLLVADWAQDVVIGSPSMDRWNYPFNVTPGKRAKAPVFRATQEGIGITRHGTFILGFDTIPLIPSGLPADHYSIESVKLRLLTGSNFEAHYDPTYDPVAAFLPEGVPGRIDDEDQGFPVELFGTGFRNGLDMFSWKETDDFIANGEEERNAYPAILNDQGNLEDVTLAVNYEDPKDVKPFAIGVLDEILPGDFIPEDSWMEFDLDLSQSSTVDYLRQGMAAGRLIFTVTSLAAGGQGSRTYPEFHTSDSLLGIAPSLELRFSIHETSPSVIKILDLKKVLDQWSIRFLADSVNSLRIRWTHDFVTWNSISDPEFQTQGDGEWMWTDGSESPNIRFYQIFKP
ncbi:hypothetical protein OAH46_02065 [Verrucomicrobia bacterium]|nr:hypothetical protein [Verrucomicrobiota bacterium]